MGISSYFGWGQYTDQWMLAHYQKHTSVGGGLKAWNGEAEAFVAVRKLILGQKFSSRQMSNIKDFYISFTSQTASYTNPQTGAKEEIDLLEIEDPTIAGSIKNYFEKSGGKKWANQYKVQRGCKGNLSGPEALQRKTDALKVLPNEFGKELFKKALPKRLAEIENPRERSVVSTRLLFVQEHVRDLVQKFQATLKEKNTQYQAAQTETQKKALAQEIKHLQEALKPLQNFDAYALSMLLLEGPVGNVWSMQLEEIAQKVEAQVKRDIEARVPRNWWFQKRGLQKEELEYAADVANELRKRGARFLACQNHHIKIKKDNLVGALLDAATEFVAKGKDYTGESLKSSPLFRDLGADVLGNINAASILSAHKVPFAPPEAYEAKKEDSADQKAGSLGQVVAQHANAVNRDLTLDQVPLPLTPSAGVGSLVKTTAQTAAVAVPLLLVGRYLGLFNPDVMGAVQYIQQQNPAQMLGGLFLLNHLRDRAISWVRPQERNLNTGAIEQRMNWRRAAMVGTVALGTLCAAYQAATGDEDSLVAQAGGYSLPMIQIGGAAANYAWQNPGLINLASLLPSVANYFMPGTVHWIGSKVPGPVKAVAQAGGNVLSNVARVSGIKNLVSMAWNWMPRIHVLGGLGIG